MGNASQLKKCKLVQANIQHLAKISWFSFALPWVGLAPKIGKLGKLRDWLAGTPEFSKLSEIPKLREFPSIPSFGCKIDDFRLG